MQYHISSINELPETASPKDEYLLDNQWPQYTFVYQQFPANIASRLKQSGRWVIARYYDKYSDTQSFEGYKFFDKVSDFPTKYASKVEEKQILMQLRDEGYEPVAARVAATSLLANMSPLGIAVDMSTGNTYKTDQGSFIYPYDLKQLTSEIGSITPMTPGDDPGSPKGETSLDK